MIEDQKNIARASAELKSQMPNYARIQADAHEIEMKKQREEEMQRREAFEKRASEIGYANALVEASTKVDTAIAEAKTALSGAIVYKKYQYHNEKQN